MKLLTNETEEESEPVTDDIAIRIPIPLKQIPKRRVKADKQTEQQGTGPWWDGTVLFISNEEIVEVPARCKSTSIYTAASRMVRAARPGLPRMQRKGNLKRIHTIVVQTLERARG